MYEAHFVSKITDADMKNSETQVWLDFSLACEYISQEGFNELYNDAEEVGITFLYDRPSKKVFA